VIQLRKDGYSLCDNNPEGGTMYPIRCRKFHMALISLILVSIFITFELCAGADYKVVTTETLKEMIDSKKEFVLIDARTKEEYDDAHIVDAVNIPENKFENASSKLPTDKNALLVIYCNGVKCGKSKKLAQKVEVAGYRNIMIYSEGFPVWEEKDLCFVAGPNYSKKIETTMLSPAQVESLLKEDKGDYVLVDVREPVEFNEGHIPSAINIPVDIFASKSDVLPKEKKIIVYCNTGSRSYIAYRKLMKLAYPNIFQTLYAPWKEAGMQISK